MPSFIKKRGIHLLHVCIFMYKSIENYKYQKHSLTNFESTKQIFGDLSILRLFSKTFVLKKGVFRDQFVDLLLFYLEPDHGRTTSWSLYKEFTSPHEGSTIYGNFKVYPTLGINPGHNTGSNVSVYQNYTFLNHTSTFKSKKIPERGQGVNALLLIFYLKYFIKSTPSQEFNLVFYIPRIL